MPEYLTAKEAAESLNVAVGTIHIAFREGRLPYVLKYGKKLVSRKALEDYRARTRPDGDKPRGRPRKSSE